MRREKNTLKLFFSFYIDLCTDVFGADYDVQTIPGLMAQTAAYYANPYQSVRIYHFLAHFFDF